jgi:hypothetical protein
MSDSAPETESAQPPERIDLDGLFTLYKRADGTLQVEYGKQTAPLELGLRWKLPPSESKLALSLLFLSSGLEELFSDVELPAPRFGILGASNMGEVYRVADKLKGRALTMGVILKHLSDSIGTELAIVADDSESPKAVKEAKGRIEKKVSKALDALSQRSERTAHGSATTAKVNLDTGETREAVLPWITLEIARQLVGETQQLPTKGEIQLAIEERYPELRGLGKTKWRNTWNECGLSTLDQGEPWELEERKRAMRSRTKKA